LEEFFNSLEEIVQRPESRRSEKQSICSQNRRSVDRPVDRHAQHGAQEQFGRPTTGASFCYKSVGQPTGTSPLSVGVRSIEGRSRPKEGVGRPIGRSTDESVY